jgi:hypothetical protein
MSRTATNPEPWYKVQIKTHHGWADLLPLRVFGLRAEAQDFAWDLGWEKIRHEFIITECDIFGESL